MLGRPGPTPPWRMDIQPPGMAPSTADKSAFQKSAIHIAVPEDVPSIAEHMTQDAVDALLNKQKPSLYFDEITPVLLLLRMPFSPHTLATCLPYLNVSITAHLTAFPAQAGSTPQLPSEDPPIKLVLDTVSIVHPKLVVLQQSPPNATTAIFQANLHLVHPERMLSQPGVYFSASVFLKPPPVPPPDSLDDYLPSGIPLSSNILSPLLSNNLTLPSSRLDKVIPLLAPSDADIRPLRTTSASLKLVSALSLGTIRTLFPSSLYLSLGLFVSPSSPPLYLLSAEATIPNLPLLLLPVPSLPGTLSPSSRTTLVFTSLPTASSAQISLSISATLPGDRTLLFVRTVPGSTARAPRERGKHWSLPSSSRPATAINGDRGVEGELRLSLSGPARVNTGDEFAVRLDVLNATSRRRRLAIVGPAKGKVKGGKYRADVVALDTEVRIVLPPGGCGDVKLRLRAMGVGVVGTEGIVVVDLDSRETCVIGEGWEGVCVDS